MHRLKGMERAIAARREECLGEEFEGYLLVVDDEEMNRDMLSRRLRRSGYQVVTAADGEAALRVVADEPIDLVLLDVMMPGLSGTDLLGMLRKSYSAAELPVIMATAKTDSRDMVAALSLGANDYITKPIDYPVALARIKTQLERKRAEDRLRESEERYALAMSGANDGLWDWNLRTGEVFYSERWAEMLGVDKGAIEPVPESWFGRLHPADVANVRSRLEEHLSGKTRHFECEARIRKDDDRYIWVLTRGVAVRNGRGKVHRMAGSMTDITERKIRDPLTGLANGELLTEQLERAIETARRDETHFGLLLLTVDRYKMVSGQLGQAGADALLRAVAELLDRNVRSADTVARLEGDVFGVMAESIEDPQQVARLARRLQQAFARPVRITVGDEEHDLLLTLTVGIVVARDYPSPETAIADATTALARAGTDGIGGVRIFDPSMHNRALARLQLETDLTRAVTREEFLAYYQPIVDLHAGRICGFEALVRWAHPTRGMVSPADFVPIAEETGTIGAIGRIVLRMACQQLAAWTMHMPDTELFVTVNVSARQLSDKHFLPYLTEVLQATAAPADRLKLEITESTVMQEAESALELLAQIRELGVKIAIDDFGTGHSSLSYLHQLPADTLKIDQSFIRRMNGQFEKGDIVRTVLVLAHGLGLDVVAEGIETQEDLVALRELRCDMGQGYLFAKPLPPADALELLLDEPVW